MKFNVEINGKIFQVEVDDLNSRPVVAVVDGERFDVWPEEDQAKAESSQTVRTVVVPDSAPAPSTPAASSASGNELTAPLPGVIVAVLVKPGEEVARGQELITLEAMKMKNAIKSHRAGIIASVEVSVGDQVAHGQSLVTFKA